MLDRFDKVRLLAPMLCLAAGMAVSGCDGPPVGRTDYRVQHPIAVQEKVFSLSVSVPESGRGTTAAQMRMIRAFAAEYLRRGRGPLLISYGTGAAGPGKYRSMIVDLLAGAGVPKQMVFSQARAPNSRG